MNKVTPPSPEPSPIPRTRRTPPQRAEIVAQLEASGLTVADFCRQEALPRASVYLWRRQQREADAAADDGPPRMLRVEAASAPAAETGVTARLTNGVELRVAIDYLPALVSAVAAC